ncbi:MAG: extracellular solute-binding protein family 1 [Paenibacillus sp.]|nr:extracellular solute-binding protein family 1 [Paenibacillus sp.]
MNRKNRKSFVFLLLVSALSVGVAAGCSEGSTDGKENTDTAPAAQSNYPGALTYWVPMNANVSATMISFGEIASYKELESRTGAKVDFQHPAFGQERDQFNLMIASGRLPDVIEYLWSGVPKGPDNAIKEKRIIRLNELIEKHAPNLSKVLKENPEFRKLATTDEGNLYMFPYFADAPDALVYNGPALRKDWLDKLGLQVPTTLREWESVLISFRDMDPNGNGIKDEIPLLFDAKVMNVGNAFVGAYGITSVFYQDNGKVKYGPIDPRFKQFLVMMNRWYEEGLIDKDFATLDQKLKDAKMTEGLVGSMAMNTGYGIGSYTGAMAKTDPAFKLIAAPYPSLEPGGQSIGHKESPFNGRGAAITASAEQPEKIVRWLDYAYGEAGKMLFNFGIENVSYKMENGYPKLTSLITNNPDQLSMSLAMTRYSHGTFSGPFVYDKRFAEQYASMPEQKQAISLWTKADHSKLMPPLTMNSAESLKQTSIMNDVNPYYEEMVNKFIMGVEPLDNFDKFVATIRKMGIDEVIRLKQDALDRFVTR